MFAFIDYSKASDAWFPLNFIRASGKWASTNTVVWIHCSVRILTTPQKLSLQRAQSTRPFRKDKSGSYSRVDALAR